MRIRTSRDLGRLVRQQRKQRGWSQQELAMRAKVSRNWLVGVEQGKPTAEVGLLLQTLCALDLMVDVRNPEAVRPSTGPRGAVASMVGPRLVHNSAASGPRVTLQASGRRKEDATRDG